MNLKHLLIVGCIALFLGIFSWPYFYYVLLRWVIAIIAGLAGYSFYTGKQESLAYVFAGIVVLFNPILPVYLTKGIWVILDLVCAFIFLYAIGKTTK